MNSDEKQANEAPQPKQTVWIDMTSTGLARIMTLDELTQVPEKEPNLARPMSEGYIHPETAMRAFRREQKKLPRDQPGPLKGAPASL